MIHLAGNDSYISKSLPIFHPEVIEFIGELSTIILNDNRCKIYKDLITFAFFCRKSSFIELSKKYNDSIRIGRGLIFHITPSNVPINFAYSLISGLITGNVNIVKISSKDFPQVNLLCDLINDLLQKYELIKNYIHIVKYDNNEIDLTKYFSILCDIRIIWGGDDTISNIRKCVLSAKAFDVTFRDRYSFCIINSDEYVKSNNYINIAKDFYNDTYLFDQNACSSPHLILWYGTKKEEAKNIFWTELHKLVKNNYNLNDISSVDKYVATCELAIRFPTMRNIKTNDNLIVRNNLNMLDGEIYKYHSNCGYFIESDLNSLDEIKDIVNEKYQTLAYYGFDREYLRTFFKENIYFGIDRIVKIGQTSSFSFVWDGYDLITTLSRILYV